VTTSEQARADAIADAETLRLFATDGRHFCCVTWPDHVLFSAFNLGAGPKKHIKRGWAERAGNSAAGAARAAFRAVPGLRA